ncbi:hypothetical protein AgCh_035830 [Apium graveolens]
MFKDKLSIELYLSQERKLILRLELLHLFWFQCVDYLLKFNLDYPLMLNVDYPLKFNFDYPLKYNLDYPLMHNVDYPLMYNVDYPLMELLSALSIDAKCKS